MIMPQKTVEKTAAAENKPAEINKAAGNHCSYYAMNANTSCTSNAHMEVMSCAGFTGADPGARLKAAGYMS